MQSASPIQECFQAAGCSTEVWKSREIGLLGVIMKCENTKVRMQNTTNKHKKTLILDWESVKTGKIV